jgi:glycosyltransferase involved in cell wall biosynthesis
VKTPAVSVIMAVKNAGRFLRSALDSIAAQTYQNFEVIVVDGGSTDDSMHIVSRYDNIRCIQQIGAGFPEAWNQGIENAKAPLICFLDGDDVWEPEKLALQTALLSNSPDKDYAIGRVRFFSDPDQPLPRGFKRSLMTGSHIGYLPGTIMIRRTAFERVGPFEAGWKIASDIVWFRKLREGGFQAGIIDQVLLNKRVHANNLSLSTSWQVYRHELFLLLKATLDRNRARRANRSTERKHDAR